MTAKSAGMSKVRPSGPDPGQHGAVSATDPAAAAGNADSLMERGSGSLDQTSASADCQEKQDEQHPSLQAGDNKQQLDKTAECEKSNTRTQHIKPPNKHSGPQESQKQEEHPSDQDVHVDTGDREQQSPADTQKGKQATQQMTIPRQDRGPGDPQQPPPPNQVQQQPEAPNQVVDHHGLPQHHTANQMEGNQVPRERTTPSREGKRNFLPVMRAKLSKFLPHNFTLLLEVIVVSAVTCVLVTWLLMVMERGEATCPAGPCTDTKALSRLRERVDQLQKQTETIEASLQALRGEISQCRAEMTADKDKFKKLEENINSLRAEFRNMDKMPDTSGTLNFTMCLLVVMIVVILVIVCRPFPRVQQPDPRPSRVQWHVPDLGGRGSAEVMGDQDILSQVVGGQRLLLEVGVVSFRGNTAKRHRELVANVLRQEAGLAGRAVRPHVVERHGDILRLPRTRAVLLFVDFNERNIILENPDKGTGDLRLTTAQAAAKMGADVFVIYVGDRDSAKLDEGELLNPGLTSVSSHSELRRLHQQQHVMSVQEGFSPSQERHLAACLLRVLH